MEAMAIGIEESVQYDHMHARIGQVEYLGRKLIEGVSNPTIVRDDAARRLFPAIAPMGLRRAIERALANEDEEFAVTRWSDALSSSGRPASYGGVASLRLATPAAR
jgi:hypothetical protein